MAVFELYSKRQKKLRGEIPDVYMYDNLPRPLKVQIIQIIKDTIGTDKSFYINEVSKAYESLHKILCREYGIFSLDSIYGETDEEKLSNYFFATNKIEEAIDLIELFFKYIDRIIREKYNYKDAVNFSMTPDEAVEELNIRFREHAIGYSFEGGEIVRVDSTYVHAEISKPTISLLSDIRFRGANEEYLKAHGHYRHGENKECLTECLNAFESTMKIICEEKGWSYAQTDTAKKLIQICFSNNLVPSFSQNQFTSLQNLLESGIPPIRNKLGSHGQGVVPREVNEAITRYALNLTGTNIIFLINQSGL